MDCKITTEIQTKSLKKLKCEYNAEKLKAEASKILEEAKNKLEE